MDKPRELNPLHYIGGSTGEGRLKGKRGQEKMFSYTVAFKKQQGMTYDSECQEQVPGLRAPDQSITVRGKAQCSPVRCLSGLSPIILLTVDGKGHSGKP